MNVAVARELVGALSELYGEQAFPSDEVREVHDATLTRLLSHVPEPNGWTVARWGMGTVLILADDLLFSLLVERVSPEGHPDAVLTSRWLEGHASGVEVRWDAEVGTDAELGYTTHWTFNLHGGEPIAIAGFIHTSPREELDRTEVFARAVARRLGWRLAG